MEQTTGRFLLLVKVLVRDLQTRESWSRVNYEQKLSEQSSSFEDARVVGKTKDTRQDFWLGCVPPPPSSPNPDPISCGNVFVRAPPPPLRLCDTRF